MSRYQWMVSLLLATTLFLSACQPLLTSETASSGAAAVGAAATAGHADQVRKILLIPREGSMDWEFDLTHELGVMRSMLEDAGFEVVIATESGNPLRSPSITVEPDLQLADVDVRDYEGIIMACMSAGDPGPVPEEAIEIVQEAVAQGKPVAAQRGTVLILAKAGLLEGRDYAYRYYMFPEGHYVGTGVVQDGNIITSGMCPYAARQYGAEDGTPELTSKLIESLLVKDSSAPAESTSDEIECNTWDEIFVIGEEDKSMSEFASGGFDQYQEYICQIDVDCKVEDIPGGLYEGDSPRGYRDEAPKLTIVFQLSRDYSELVLRLARAGSETTAVSVDGGEPLLVTAEMLGSGDEWVVGSYDLSLGPLQAGLHSITFVIHSDGLGNGGYGWDALSLHAR